MPLLLTQIQHIGIPVLNLEKSVSFYQKLGFSSVMSATFPHENETGNVQMMQSGSIIIELYQFPATVLSSIANRQDGHIDHIAFEVNDIDEAFISLKTEGFQTVEDAPIFLPFWEKGCKFFHIIGPNGERLEFNQRLK